MNAKKHAGDSEDAKQQLSLEAVRSQIAEAIINHQLLPKTKLGEEKLAGALRVSRARVREALARLEVEHMVVSIPNRGTFVAAPSVSEARQILHARRVIESETVRMLARSATPKQIKELKRCVDAERSAWEAGDRQRAITLSREFHYLIADMSGNVILADLLRQVVARMSLAIALYDRPRRPDCMFDEHVELLNAISAHDEERATDIALGHLDHMAEALDAIPDEEAEPNLDAIFGASE
ncbi:MAG: GntR family transcriptional regulator [Oricola sp.]